MNYGGPVWHASTSATRLALGRDALRDAALKALDGVGDPAHEWWDWTGYAFHVRRLLTPQESYAIGPAVDVRGKPEGRRRAERILRHLPPVLLDDLLEELRECGVMQ